MTNLTALARKMIVVCMIVMLLACTVAHAEYAPTDDGTIFDVAIGELKQINNRQRVAQAQEMFSGIDSNYMQANMFSMYASAIIDVYDDQYDSAESKLSILSMNNEFGKLLKENGLPSCDVVSRYISARRMEAQSDYSAAFDIYRNMNLMDSLERSVQLLVMIYDQAQEQYQLGNYELAEKMFSQVSGYRDSEEMAKKSIALLPTPTPVPTLKPTPRPTIVPTLKPTPVPTTKSTPISTSSPELQGSSVKVGSIIRFGHYEQDNNYTNGPEDIEWIVLDREDRDGNRVLLLTQDGLDIQPYNTKFQAVTWENCSLRRWLNEVFVEKAFTEAERDAIIYYYVDNGEQEGSHNYNSAGNVYGGAHTEDRVFLLSCSEAHKYAGAQYYGSSDNQRSLLSPSIYAREKMKSTIGDLERKLWDNTIIWWLRSPGDNQNCASCVRGYVAPDSYFGELSSCPVDYSYGYVRPAIWAWVD